MTIMQVVSGFVSQGLGLIEKYIIEIVIGVGVLCIIIAYLIFIKGRGL